MRPRVEPTDDWQELCVLVQSPEQERYELLRSNVLFGQLPDECAQPTGVADG